MKKWIDKHPGLAIAALLFMIAFSEAGVEYLAYLILE